MRYVISLLVAAALVAIAVVIFALVLQPNSAPVTSAESQVPLFGVENSGSIEEGEACPAILDLHLGSTSEKMYVDTGDLNLTFGVFRFKEVRIANTAPTPGWKSAARGRLRCIFEREGDPGSFESLRKLVSLISNSGLVATPFHPGGHEWHEGFEPGNFWIDARGAEAQVCDAAPEECRFLIKAEQEYVK